MAYGGTGLPSPDSGNVLTQAPNVVDAERFTNARAWGQIAQVGEKIAHEGATAMKDAEHQRQVGYLADRENAVNDWTVENRAKSAGKPDEFKANAEAFRDGTIANAEPWAVPHISRYINQHTNSAYAGILHEKLAQDKHLSSEALTTNILTSENDLVGAAMGGLPIATHAMALRARLDASVTAGFHPKEWADARFEMTLSKAADETAARSAVEIYHKAGYEPAVDHLRKNILENNELSLKPEQKQAAFRRGMEAIRLEKQVDLQQRGALTIEAHDMKSSIDAGVPVDEGAYRDLQSALARSGAAAAHRSLTVAYEVKQQTRGMSVDQLAQATNVSRANAIVSVSTPGGARVNVSQQAAPAFVGFLTDLEAAGAPVKDVGGYNPRNIAGTNTPSQHSYGNAIDIDQTGRNESGIKAWGVANRDKLDAIERKWGMKGGQNFSNPDWGHWEWTGASTAPQPAGPYSGDIAKGVQTAFVAQARKDLPAYKTAIERGAYLDHDSIAAVRYAGKVSGDAHWEREVENLAIANEVGLRTQDLPIEQRQAARDSVMAELKVSGLSPVDQNYISDIVKRTAALRDKQVREDPIGYSIDQGWGTPKPLDLSTVDNARYGLQERILRVRGVAEHERVPVGIPLRQSERDAFANAISNGKPEQAGVAMSALATVPDDMIGKVLGSDEIKTALTGAVHSADPARYSQAMTFMSTMWRRQPDLTAHVFGQDAVAELKNWETNGRYMTPEQLADDRKRKVMDPQAAARQHTEIEAARTALKPDMKFENVVAKFDTSLAITPGPIARALGSQPLPPTPTDPTKPLPAMSQGERNAFMGDFEVQASRLMAGGMKKDDAIKQAVEMMKTVWKRSDINGGRLMRDAPEFAAKPNGELYNPQIDGSQEWMKKQVESAIGVETGKPVVAVTERAAYRAARDAARDAGTSTPQNVTGGMNYQLVPDAQTKAEIERGASPSYNIVLQDKTSQKWEVLPRRFQFNADEARAASYGMQPAQAERRDYLTGVDDAVKANIEAGGAGRALIREADKAIPADEPVPEAQKKSEQSNLSIVERAALNVASVAEKAGLGGTAGKLYNDFVQRGRTEAVTEKDLSENDRAQLKELVLHVADNKGKSSGHIDYRDYGTLRSSKSFLKQANDGVFDSNILGGFDYKIHADGTIEVTDKWDFNVSKGDRFDDNIAAQALSAVMQPKGLLANIGRKVIPDTGGKGIPVRIKI